MPEHRPATVWAATHVPSRSPIAGFGEEGYSVAWVDGPDGRVQVLVSGPTPAAGTAGRLAAADLEGYSGDLFEVDQ